MPALLVNGDLLPVFLLEMRGFVADEVRFSDGLKELNDVVDSLLLTFEHLLKPGKALLVDTVHVFILVKRSAGWWLKRRSADVQFLHVPSRFELGGDVVNVVVVSSSPQKEHCLRLDDVIDLVEQELPESSQIAHCVNDQLFGEEVLLVVLEEEADGPEVGLEVVEWCQLADPNLLRLSPPAKTNAPFEARVPADIAVQNCALVALGVEQVVSKGALA